ncbi:unnamed protein product [Timema podura]|uniref:Uncharacterized protein n=1 Tax=Timema podura TaxID=61482 RepID=A0ABN7P1C8_TIMPD|nr:unnamed protein product [Timema podura]
MERKKPPSSKHSAKRSSQNTVEHATKTRKVLHPDEKNLAVEELFSLPKAVLKPPEGSKYKSKYPPTRRTTLQDMSKPMKRPELIVTNPLTPSPPSPYPVPGLLVSSLTSFLSLRLHLTCFPLGFNPTSTRLPKSRGTPLGGETMDVFNRARQTFISDFSIFLLSDSDTFRNV